jgi:hypothetical protein
MIPSRPPPPAPAPISLPKLLLVEGSTPLHFFEALLQRLGLSAQVEIRDFHGVPDFKAYLADLAKSNAFKTLVTSVGVVRDAEDKPAASARRSVQDALVAAGLGSTGAPSVRTAIFILPDDTRAGMIETLCMEAARNERTLGDACACVDEFFACLRTHSIAMPTGIRFAKHEAQAYLATRSEVQLFAGLAAYRDYWPFDNAVFDPIKQFLRAL